MVRAMSPCLLGALFGQEQRGHQSSPVTLGNVLRTFGRSLDVVKGSANAETCHPDVEVFAKKAAITLKSIEGLIESWSSKAVNK